MHNVIKSLSFRPISDTGKISQLISMPKIAKISYLFDLSGAWQVVQFIPQGGKREGFFFYPVN